MNADVGKQRSNRARTQLIRSDPAVDASFVQFLEEEARVSCVQIAIAANLGSMAGELKLDETDRRILELLSDNARRTIADIAARVNLSPAPVKRRIDRLQQIGVIAGYTVLLDHAMIGPSIDAFTELRFAGDADIDEILREVKEIPEIHEVFTMAGDPDALLRIRVDDVEHLREVVNRLRRTGRVTGTKTLMVLDRWARPSAG